jgi:hypothetical protein
VADAKAGGLVEPFPSQLRHVGDQTLETVDDRFGRSHATYVRSHDVRTSVKGNVAAPHVLGEDAGMSAQRKPDPESKSPVAERIRGRLREMGQTESGFSEAFGKDRTVLSTQLRRLDAGGNLRTDILQRLESYLGKSSQWILTGVEPEGVRLADDDRWADAAAQAKSEMGYTDEQIAAAGGLRIPERPERMNPTVVAGFVQALTNAGSVPRR